MILSVEWGGRSHALRTVNLRAGSYHQAGETIHKGQRVSRRQFGNVRLINRYTNRRVANYGLSFLDGPKKTKKAFVAFEVKTSKLHHTYHLPPSTLCQVIFSFSPQTRSTSHPLLNKGIGWEVQFNNPLPSKTDKPAIMPTLLKDFSGQLCGGCESRRGLNFLIQSSFVSH